MKSYVITRESCSDFRCSIFRWLLYLQSLRPGLWKLLILVVLLLRNFWFRFLPWIFRWICTKQKHVVEDTCHKIGFVVILHLEFGGLNFMRNMFSNNFFNFERIQGFKVHLISSYSKRQLNKYMHLMYGFLFFFIFKKRFSAFQKLAAKTMTIVSSNCS